MFLIRFTSRIHRAVLAGLGVGFLLTSPTYAQDTAKEDYITCWKQPCVKVAGSIWSEKNPNGVAVSVRMGIKPAVTDDEIKMVLTHDFIKHGAMNIKFFYEQNDALANLIFFHVRGGTEGPFLIDTVRQEVSNISKRALNTNPIFKAN